MLVFLVVIGVFLEDGVRHQPSIFALLKGVPRKRIRPIVIGRADAVQAVAFPLSDESSYITGSEMVVDGSLTIGVPQKSEAPETIF